MKILITGVAGFIGFHVARKLLTSNVEIVGIDNINEYYDVNLKKSRLSELTKIGLIFYKIDISNRHEMDDFFLKETFDVIIHLAAQAGVRYSIENPHAYIDSNIVGFLNILEGCRRLKVKHFMYASSSSVYGLSKKTPFSENIQVDYPISFYAATKKSNELMAYSYSHLYKLPCTGLRFFTVYGPWGRPDMAYFKFVKQILNNEKINIYGHGKMLRDFTYIDDVVEAIIKLIPKIPCNIKNVEQNYTPWKIYNIGNNKPENLERFISIIERELNKKAIRNYTEPQPGDVIETSADISRINKLIDFSPKTTVNQGLALFIKWYKNYYI